MRGAARGRKAKDVGKLTKCEHDSSLILPRPLSLSLSRRKDILIGYILVVQTRLTKILLTFYLQNAFVANGNWHRTQ